MGNRLYLLDSRRNFLFGQSHLGGEESREGDIFRRVLAEQRRIDENFFPFRQAQNERRSVRLQKQRPDQRAVIGVYALLFIRKRGGFQRKRKDFFL